MSVVPEAPEMSDGGGGDIIAAANGITSGCGPPWAWGGRGGGGGGGGNLGFKGIKSGCGSSWSSFKNNNLQLRPPSHFPSLSLSITNSQVHLSPPQLRQLHSLLGLPLPPSVLRQVNLSVCPVLLVGLSVYNFTSPGGWIVEAAGPAVGCTIY